MSGAEAAALLGLGRVKVENSVFYGLSQTHKCLSMSALDMPAPGRVIIWFALGEGPVPHSVL